MTKQIDAITYKAKMVSDVSSETIKNYGKKIINKAKNKKGKEIAHQQTKFCHMSLISTNEETKIIEKILENKPAIKLLNLCKRELIDK